MTRRACSAAVLAAGLVVPLAASPLGYDVSSFDEGLDWPTCDRPDDVICEWERIPFEEWLDLEADLVETRIGGDGPDLLSSDLEPDATIGSVAVIQLGRGGDDQHMAQLALDALVARGRQLLGLGEGDDEAVVEARIVGNGHDALLYNEVLGGSGNDRIEARADGAGPLDNVFSVNVVDAGAGDDYIETFAIDELAADGSQVENRIAAGDGDDFVDAKVIGYSNSPLVVSNVVFAGRGDDVVQADCGFGSNFGSPSGVNALWGGLGDDRLHARQSGSLENSTTDLTAVLDGGRGNDELLAESKADGESVLAFHRLDGGPGHDLLTSRIDIALRTGELGNETRNELSGGSGNDQLEARLTGTFPGYQEDPPPLPLGENRLRGGNGRDTLLAVIESPVSGRSVLEGGNGPDSLVVVGGNGNVLDGGNGRDRLYAGRGDDRLIGGPGPDLFHFDAAEDQGANTVADFRPGADVVRFSGVTDEGRPGLVDDLDAISTFTDPGRGGDLVVDLASGTRITFEGLGTGRTKSWHRLLRGRGWRVHR